MEPKIQNTDGRLILTAEVTKNKIAKTSIIYLNKFCSPFFSRYVYDAKVWDARQEEISMSTGSPSSGCE